MFDYIEIFYDRQRKHESLSYRSPEQFEIGRECAQLTRPANRGGLIPSPFLAQVFSCADKMQSGQV